MESDRKDVSITIVPLHTVPTAYTVVYTVLETAYDASHEYERAGRVFTIPNYGTLMELLHALGQPLHDMRTPLVLWQVDLDALETVLRRYAIDQ